jgi:hypothetical protein
MPLTGRFTFRRSLGGKIILQIEEEVRTMWPASRRKAFKRRWRDASLMDLAAPELRALIDLRYKPQFMAHYDYLAPDPGDHQPHDIAADPESADDSIPKEGAGVRHLKGAAAKPAPIDTNVEIERLDQKIGRIR